MPLLLAKLPDQDTLQRLLDAPDLVEVAHEPGVFVYVLEDDGTHRQVLPRERA